LKQAASASSLFHWNLAMPTIRVEMFEGRTPEQKQELVKALTQATVSTLGTSPEAVDVILTEIKKTDWATGGVLWSEKSK
jgi:4-oxalocrotonate tautomerase